MEAEMKFMSYVGKNFDRLKDKMKRYCASKGMTFDEDIFDETILKMHDKIKTKGIEDDSDSGYQSYFFIAFKTNLLREKQYSRNKKLDDNVLQDDIENIYDAVYNAENDSVATKLQKDLTTDFKVLQLLLLVDRKFDTETSYLFRLKFLERLTYKDLAAKTHIKDARSKVVNAINYLRENAETIEKDINEKFLKEYGDFLEFGAE